MTFARNLIRRSIHIEARIEKLGYKLPPLPPTPKGSYINFIRYGNVLHISGHLPQTIDGKLIKGRLGEDMKIEDGQYAARLAALQMLATVKKACDDLDNVKKVIKVIGFVNSTNDFTSQATVMNGCSGFHDLKPLGCFFFIVIFEQTFLENCLDWKSDSTLDQLSE